MTSSMRSEAEPDDTCAGSPSPVSVDQTLPDPSLALPSSSTNQPGANNRDIDVTLDEAVPLSNRPTVLDNTVPPEPTGDTTEMLESAGDQGQSGTAILEKPRVPSVSLSQTEAADVTADFPGSVPGSYPPSAPEPGVTVGEEPAQQQHTLDWANHPSSSSTTVPSSSGASGKPASTTDYEILGVLGRGGMGVVYKARQVALNRTVALKMISSKAHASPDVLARFSIEARAVAQLQHPNIVQIFEVGERDGQPFFSLEYLEGGSLQNRYTDASPPTKVLARLVETLARAMHFAHEHGIIHRDLKPANILFGADGTPKIADFGLAKRIDDESLEEASQTATNAVLGTPTYMAPEQAEGKTREVGPGADIYALGAILYDLLTGRPPFRGTTVLDTLQMVRTAEPIPPRRLQPKVPLDLQTICLKCLEKDARSATPRRLSWRMTSWRSRTADPSRPVRRRHGNESESGYGAIRRRPRLLRSVCWRSSA